MHGRGDFQHYKYTYNVMEFKRCILFFLFTGLAASSSASFSSDSMFEAPSFILRKVLEFNSSCSINFDTLNYTIITSRCQGPPYPIDQCCDAFKEFACPISDNHVNDANGTCTDIMLDSITRAGNYPPDLFSHECLLQEDRQGLECDAPAGAVSSDSKNKASTLSRQFLLVVFSIIVLTK